jgi:hypothetical protein
MLFLPGNPCPACRRTVYGDDDFVVVSELPGVRDLPGCQPGLYHRDCFHSAPFCDAYLALDARDVRQELEGKRAVWTLMGMDDHFALVRKPVINEYSFFFLRHAAELVFRDLAELREFARQVRNPERRPAADEPKARVSVHSRPGGWTVAYRQTVPLTFEFSAGDFAKILAHLKRSADALVGQTLDLGRLAAELNVEPGARGCPLERAKGVVRKVEELEATKSVQLVLAVEKTSTLILSGGEMERLRFFLKVQPELRS